MTYALLKAIKQRPDILDDNKFLDVSKWFDVSRKTVSDISQQNNAIQDPQLVSSTNFNIGIVDSAVIDSVNLPGDKPLFARSSFQNKDENIADR